MEAGFDRASLQKWLRDIVSTEDRELVCEDLDRMLETIVAIGARGEDIRAILPDVAVHLDHCPECGEVYETLVALARDGSQ
jgi:hypothetical protein